MLLALSEHDFGAAPITAFTGNILHFQQAVFRRQGAEQSRTPHILYIDEFPRHMNLDFQRLLAIGWSFTCAIVLAL